jgi:hypothetical protein
MTPAIDLCQHKLLGVNFGVKVKRNCVFNYHPTYIVIVTKIEKVLG